MEVKFPEQLTINVTKDEASGRIVGIAYIMDVVLGPECYIELIHLLRTAKKGDDWTVKIGTPGGRVHTFVELGNAIRTSEATVTTEIVGIAYSCGAYLFSQGDQLKVNTFSKFMLHGSRGGDMGETLQIEDRAKNSNEYFMYILKEIQNRGLIVQEEYDYLITKKRDKFISAATLKQRIAEINKNA